MGFFYLLPMLLGVTVVVQGTMNRQIGAIYGLSTAVLINAAVFFVLSLCFFLVAKYTPSLVPEFLQVKSSDSAFSLKYIIPGSCGFLLVMGLPWAIQNIGAARSFLLLIVAQILTGFVWDFFDSATQPHLLKISGALLTIVGGALILFSP